MQGIEATFDDLSFEGGDSPQRVLPKIVPCGAALALAGAVSVWALHWLGSVASRDGFCSVDAGADRDAGHLEALRRHRHRRQSAGSTEVAPLARCAAAAGCKPRSPPRVALAPFPLPSLEAFPPSSPVRRSRRSRACRCRPGAMRPRSARRKASPCRRLVRPGSAPRPSPRRPSATRHDPTWRSLVLPPARQSQRHRKTVRMGAPILAGRRLHHHGAHRRHSAGGR